MSYIDIASLQTRTGVTYAGAELAYVTSLIGAIKNYIDRYTSRTFEEVASADYTYRGNNCRTLEIDEFQTITAIKEYDRYGELQDTFATSDYEVLPYNTLPIDRIHLLEGTFSGYKYKITGKKGYTATCPDDIEMVATEILANILSQKGGLQSESIEQYSYTIAQVATSNPVFVSVLDSYKKVLI